MSCLQPAIVFEPQKREDVEADVGHTFCHHRHQHSQSPPSNTSYYSSYPYLSQYVMLPATHGGENSTEMPDMPDFGDHVDVSTFEQILEMDESDEERDFSQPLVFNFFEQANETFDKMETFLAQKDLSNLSSLGHFLKGSSATLGFTKIKDSCQEIQQFGHKQTIDGSPEPDETVCLNHISQALGHIKGDMKVLEEIMRKFFSIKQ